MSSESQWHLITGIASSRSQRPLGQNSGDKHYQSILFCQGLMLAQFCLGNFGKALRLLWKIDTSRTSLRCNQSRAYKLPCLQKLSNLNSGM